MNDPVLLVRNLSVSYPDGFVLRPLSFTLRAGEILAVAGESGSGKSTLARAVVNLFACRFPQKSGEVFLCGREVLHAPERELRARRSTECSIVFQNGAELLNPSLTLREQLYEVLKKRWPRAELAAHAARLMCDAGLCEADLSRLPRTLSGGMTQRFLIASALALSPRLVVLDEPTSALDPVAREEFCANIRSLAARGETAFLLITHDLPLARAMDGRLFVLYRGALVEGGGAAALLESPRHPYTRGLLRSCAEFYPLRDLWGIRASTQEEAPDGCPFAGRCTQALPLCREIFPELCESGEPPHLLRCHRGGITTILEGRGLTKAYDRQLVLRGVSLALQSGETVAITGPSGGGKTTLASLLAGFSAPDAGTLLFDGAPADFQSLHKREGGIQMVFQDSDGALNPRLTVEDAVCEPLRLAGLSAAARGRCAALLAQTGLPADDAFLGKWVGTLSGGQKQRVCLARALSMRPRVLVADEPTAMLDPSAKANLLRLLKGLQNETGCSLLLVTHDLAAAQKVAERIFCLEDGLLHPFVSQD